MINPTRTNVSLRCTFLLAVLTMFGFTGYASAQSWTVLPDNPVVQDLGGADITVHSVSNFTASYNVSGGGGQGAIVRWDWAGRDLSHIDPFVFGFQGDPINIRVKFEDTNDVAWIYTTEFSDSSDLQVIEIEEWLMFGIDLEDIKAIVFETDQGLAGEGNHVGEFMIYVDGLDFDEPEGIDPSDPGDAELTVLPNEPWPQDLDGTDFTQHSSTNFTVSYDINDPNPSWRGVMVRWADWAPQNLSAVTQFVFGVTGDPDAIKVEFERDDGSKTIINMLGVTDDYQHWHIADSLLDDLSDIKVISFVVDRDLAGAGNYEGEYTVFVGGLDYEEPPEPAEEIEPSDPGDAALTFLPNNPDLTDIDGADFTQLSSSNVLVEYNLDNQSWPGVTVRWGGEDYDIQDFSSVTQFVFGVMGDPDAIQLEVQYAEESRSTIVLTGVTDSYQHWHIPADVLGDLTYLRNINFLVTDDVAGDNRVGTFNFFVGGLEEPPEPDPEIEPVDPGDAELTVLPGYPGLRDVGGSDWDLLSSTNFTVTYDLTEGDSWGGVAVRWGGEPTNLTAYSEFVFGVKGDPDAIQVEFDAPGGIKTTVILLDVTENLQYWVIDTDLIDGLEEITDIVFVTNQDVAGAGNQTGSFEVHVGGLDYTPPPMEITPEDTLEPVTVLPGNPALRDLAGTEGEMIDEESFRVEYDFGAHHTNWQGVYVSRDEFAPMDLSGPAYTQIVIGVEGDPGAIRVEFEHSGGRTLFHLTGISDSRQHWHIDASLIANLDDIVAISFTAREELLGGGSDPGEFIVYIGGLAYTAPPVDINPIDPGDAEITILPGFPGLADIAGTEYTLLSPTNFTATYDVAGEPGYGGVSVGWGGNAYDLSTITQFVFGVVGDPDALLVEFDYYDEIEEVTRKTVFKLNDITDGLQYWTIDAALIDGLDEITAISFVVNQELLNGNGMAGEFEVHVGGLNYMGPYDPAEVELTTLPGNPGIFGMVDTDFEQHSSTNFTVIYDLTQVELWGGVYLGWPGPTNLTAFSEFVFGVMGDPEIITVEFVPAEGDRTAIQLQGITNQLQYWVIDADRIGGLDDISSINIVVNDNLVGDAQAGSFEFHVKGLAYTPPPPEPVDPSEAEITILPGFPDLVGLEAIVDRLSSTNFTVTYTVAEGPDYAGAVIQWAEPINLNSISEFVFGAMGDPEAIRVEFKAVGGVETRINMAGMTGALQHWIIDAAQIAGLDEIVEIVFVVDPGLAGEGNEVGTFEVHVGLEEEDPPDVDDPEFESVEVSGDRTEIWARILESETGYTYVLQFTRDLMEEPEPTWHQADSKPGNGGELILIDDDLDDEDTMRIYRIIVTAE